MLTGQYLKMETSAVEDFWVTARWPIKTDLVNHNSFEDVNSRVRSVHDNLELIFLVYASIVFYIDLMWRNCLFQLYLKQIFHQ